MDPIHPDDLVALHIGELVDARQSRRLHHPATRRRAHANPLRPACHAIGAAMIRAGLWLTRDARLGEVQAYGSLRG